MKLRKCRICGMESDGEFSIYIGVCRYCYSHPHLTSRGLEKILGRMEVIEKKLRGKKPAGSPYDAGQGGAKAFK